jgi:Tol biopolymer transport system component
MAAMVRSAGIGSLLLLLSLACGNGGDGSSGTGDSGTAETSGTGSGTGGSDGGSDDGGSSDGTGDDGSGSDSGTDDPAERSLVVYYAQSNTPDLEELYVVDVAGPEPSEPVLLAPPPGYEGGDAGPSLYFLAGGRFATFTVSGPEEDAFARFIAPLGSFPTLSPVPLELPSSPAWIDTPDMSSDGQRIAVRGSDGNYAHETIYIGEVEETGQAHDLIEVGTGSGGGYTRSPEFSPSNERVFFVSDGAEAELAQIYMVPLADDQLSPVVLSSNDQPQSTPYYHVAPSEERVVYGVGPSFGEPFLLYEVDLTSDPPGAPVLLDGNHQPPGAMVFRFAREGRTLLYYAELDDASNEVNLYARDLESGDPPVRLNDVRIYHTSGNPWGDVVIHPDDTMIVYRGFEEDRSFKSFHWVDLAQPAPTSQWLHDPLAPGETASFARFSPDGDQLLFVMLNLDTNERSAFAVDTSGAEPGPPEPLDLEVDAGETLRLLDPSPDGAWLAYPTVELPTQMPRPHLWLREIATGEDTVVSVDSGGDVELRTSFTPDSKRLLFGQVAVGAEEPNLYMVRLDGGEVGPTQLVTEHLIAAGFFWVAP